MEGKGSIRVGDTLAGRYEVVGVLGEGAMGVVYDAVHKAIGRRVAVKTLREDLGGATELVQRFQVEARAAGGLGHPNLVQILDAGQIEGGAHFLVMERVDGGSLEQVIAQGPLEVERAVELTSQVLAGLGAAHKRGIVHRDLKPANILLDRDDEGNEVAKIGDFGISKVLDKSRLGAAGSLDVRATESGSLLGTPLYMSPEQARGVTDIDPRTDLWAVGCVLYEMLCGRPPFVGDSYAEILTAVMMEPPLAPSVFRPDLPADVEAVILRALSKQREDRAPDAGTMRSMLLAAVGRRSTKVEATPLPPIAPRLSTPMAAAATAAGDDDARMLAALSRAVAEGGEGAAIGLDGSVDEKPMAVAAVEMPRPPPSTSMPSPSPSTSTSTSRAEREAAAGPALDPFAPPDNAEAVARLDIDRELIAQRTPVPGTVSAVRRSVGGAAVVPSTRGGGGRVVFVILLLAVLGAGGFAAYRYVTLGYILSPPPAEKPLQITVEAVPADADVRVAGEPLDGGRLTIAVGQTRVLIATAPGRVPVRLTVTGRVGAPAIQVRLPSQLAPIYGAGTVPLPAGQLEAAAKDMRAIDEGLTKLAPLRDCLSRTLRQATRGREAYGARAARNQPAVTIPAADVDQCGTQVDRSTAAPPEHPHLTRVANSYAQALDAVTTAQRKAASDAERFPRDGGLARKNQRALGAAFAVAEARGQELEAAVIALARSWQAGELELSGTDGDPAYALARRAAFAGHDHTLAVLIGEEGLVAAARARLDQEVAVLHAAAARIGPRGVELIGALGRAPQGTGRAEWIAWQNALADAFNRIELQIAPSASRSPPMPPPAAR